MTNTNNLPKPLVEILGVFLFFQMLSENYTVEIVNYPLPIVKLLRSKGAMCGVGKYNHQKIKVLTCQKTKLMLILTCKVFTYFS